MKAEDYNDGSNASSVEFRLENGEQLEVVRQLLKLPLPASVNPEMLIRDPARDRIVTWPSGTQVAIIGHIPLVSQVILLRPNGTFINVKLLSPIHWTDGGQVVPDFTGPSAFTLETLTEFARENFDVGASDLPKVGKN